MTEKEKEKFNRMRNALLMISKDYQSPSQLRRGCEKDYGLEFEEAIEAAYENIQAVAKHAVKGIKIAI